MSLHTTYANFCDIHATSEIYHLMVYRDGSMIVQPDEFLEVRSKICINCSGPMMSTHFEPIIIHYSTYHPVENLIIVFQNLNLFQTTVTHLIQQMKKEMKKCHSRVNNRIKRQKH